jgi:hypothetical protein
MGHHNVTFYSQDAQLKEIRTEDSERYGRWAFTCERAAIRRLDGAFQGFYRLAADDVINAWPLQWLTEWVREGRSRH